jgi:hypothetical protein
MLTSGKAVESDDQFTDKLRHELSHILNPYPPG